MNLGRSRATGVSPGELPLLSHPAIAVFIVIVLVVVVVTDRTPLHNYFAPVYQLPLMRYPKM